MSANDELYQTWKQSTPCMRAEAQAAAADTTTDQKPTVPQVRNQFILSKENADKRKCQYIVNWF